MRTVFVSLAALLGATGAAFLGIGWSASPVSIARAESLAPPPRPAPSLPAGMTAPDVIPCGNAPEGMACIPGGAFIRGTNGEPENARPESVVWVQTFFMDIHEVTVAEYRACMKAGKCPKAGPQYVDFDRPKQPINGVSWYDAKAYCEAQGKRLPTEAQWEKAARGTDGRLYPWGNDKATCELAIIEDASGKGCGVKKKGKNPEKGRPWEVGSRPANPFGLYDMAGNSWEWVQDWASHSYADCGAPCAGIEPKGPCEGKEQCKGHSLKIVRGGSWYWPASYATTVYRRTHFPSNQPFHHFGFRCAANASDGKERR